MIYLQPKHIPGMDPDYWGLMITPKGSVPQAQLANYRWAADNGAFTNKFNEQKFFNWLRGLIPYRQSCLFVTCPDRLYDAPSTMAMYRTYAREIRGLGFKVAFVAQSGMERIPLNRWPKSPEALFIGGSYDWKREWTGGYYCAHVGKRRGLWVHVGRLNGKKIIDSYVLAGADSADGTNIIFRPKQNWPKMQHWPMQPALLPDSLTHSRSM
jgi:hypothetical protein